MKVSQLYDFLNKRIPRELSCEWDNDGLACCPDPERQVKRVLLALDITEETVARAIDGGYDVILAHHPLIFRPIGAVAPGKTVAEKVIKLLITVLDILMILQ
jgi:putative NIF3 family GTP cyclohydrolase 1 type 2